jgi:hypothetical protein
LYFQGHVLRVTDIIVVLFHRDSKPNLTTFCEVGHLQVGQRLHYFGTSGMGTGPTGGFFVGMKAWCIVLTPQLAG